MPGGVQESQRDRDSPLRREREAISHETPLNFPVGHTHSQVEPGVLYPGFEILHISQGLTKMEGRGEPLQT